MRNFSHANKMYYGRYFKAVQIKYKLNRRHLNGSYESYDSICFYKLKSGRFNGVISAIYLEPLQKLVPKPSCFQFKYLNMLKRRHV